MKKLALLMVGALLAGVAGADTAFTGAISTDFANANNWTAGVAGDATGNDGTISNGLTAVYSNAEGTLDVYRSSLTVGAAGTAGTLNVNAGELLLRNSGANDLIVGAGAGSTGTVNINSGGELYVAGANADVFIGDSDGGQGAVNVNSGGTLEATKTVEVINGTLTYASDASTGSAMKDELVVDNAGTLAFQTDGTAISTIPGDTLILELGSTSTLDMQLGGTYTFGDTWTIATGIFSFGGVDGGDGTGVFGTVTNSTDPSHTFVVYYGTGLAAADEVVVELIDPAAAPTATTLKTSGAWATAANWTEGVPSATLEAFINSNLTANLAGTTGTASNLVVGSNDDQSGAVTNGSLTVAQRTRLAVANNATGIVNVATFTAGSTSASVNGIGTGSNSYGELIATSGSMTGQTLSIGADSNAVGIVNLGSGTLTHNSANIATGRGSSGTLVANTLSLSGGLNVATSQDADATITLANPIALNAINNVFIGTGANSSHTLTAADFDVTGPIGNIGVGEGTGASIKSLFSANATEGSIVVENTALDISAATHTVTAITLGEDVDSTDSLTFSGSSSATISGAMNIGTATDGTGTLSVASGTLNHANVNLATGENSDATLTAPALAMTGNLSISTGNNSDATITLGSPIVLNATNSVFIGTGENSTQNLTAANLSITGPIGNFGVGDGADSTIKALFSANETIGQITANTALDLTGANHTITKIALAEAEGSTGASLSLSGTANLVALSGDIVIAEGANASATQDLGDITTSAHEVGQINLAKGSNSFASLTFTNAALDYTKHVLVAEGEDSTATLLVKSLSSVGTNRNLNVADSAAGATGTATIQEGAVVQNLRAATSADTVATVTADSLFIKNSLVAGTGDNSSATVSVTTLNKESITRGLDIANGDGSYASVTASFGNVNVGSGSGFSIAEGDNSEGIFTLTNGTLNVDQDRPFDVATGSNSTATVYVGTINVPGTNDVNIASGADSDATVTTMGGTITAENLNLGSAGGLVLDGGNLVVIGAVVSTGGYIDVLNVASQITLDGQTEADYIALWNAGTLRREGVSGLTGDTFSDYFTVVGDVLTVSGLWPIGEITLTGPTAGELIITWDTVSGQDYQVQTNINLTAGSWGDSGALKTGTGGSISATSTVSAANVFYRVISE